MSPLNSCRTASKMSLRDSPPPARLAARSMLFS